jgi:peptidoglycan/xylan/chitin deacetylase (PgdA/CDA1 family)
VVNPPPASDNLIANPSVETSNPANPATPDKWLNNSWGTNTSQFTYQTGGHSGAKSIRAQISSYSSGDAKWYFSPVNVAANKSYTYSDYYQANVGTEVVAQIEDTSGGISYMYLGAVAANTSWTPYTATFTTPANARQVTIFHLIAGIGYLTIDDASLTLTPPPPVQTDVIPNNSLETATPGSPDMPLNWSKNNWGSNTAKFEYLNEGHSGNRSVKVTVSNYTDGDAKWYFNPLNTFQPGKMYRFSVWYKTNTIPHAVAMFLKANGTEQYFGMPNPQPNGTGDWQFYSDTFTVPLDAVAVSAFLFMPNNGWLQTDDYSITDYQPVGWNRPLVTLTFDDGYEDNVKTVLPVLNQYGFKSTQCYETMDVEGNQSAINDVKTFYNSGHEICAHTVTHPMLTKIPMSQVTYELTHSQQVLQGIIGKPVTTFASPFGDYNQAVNTEIAKYFRSHRTVDEGFNSKDNFDIYRLRVQNMTPTTSLAQVQAWIDQAKATNTWLILVYHRVADSNLDPFDTYTNDFKLQMQAISQSGVTVKTWSDALDEVTAQL